MSSPTTSAGPATAARLRLVLIVCCLAQFMVVLDVSIVNVALPSIRRSLHFDQNGLSWVVNAYTIAFAGFLLLGGRLADLFGRRRIFLTGIVLFTAASLVGGLSVNDTMLVIARGVQGLGAAIVAPATLTVLGTSFTEPAARARAFSVWGAVVGAAGALGALGGGVLTDALSWRWILFINVPIGIVGVVAATSAITELRNPRAGRRLDVLGALTMTLGLMTVVFGIVQTERYGWNSARSTLTIVIGVVVLAFFLFDQAVLAAEPIMPLHIFRFRAVSAANVVVFTSGAALFGMFYFVTLFLQQVRDYSPLRTGLAYLPLAVAITVGARASARYVQRVGPRAMLLSGMLLTVGGLFWLSRITEDSGFVAALLGPTVIVGAGQGMVMTCATIAGTSRLPLHQTGLASGLINATRQLGGALGLAILASVANTRAADLLAGQTPTTALTHHAFASGYGLALVIAAVFPAVGLIAAALAPGRPRVTAPAGEDRPLPADTAEPANARPVGNQ